MPRKKNTRAAQGAGNIRKKTVTRAKKNIPSGRRVSLLDAIPVQASKSGAVSQARHKKRYARKCSPSLLPSMTETILSRQK